MWPVFVVPYNLPPWACMDESNFMMALLIPGPSSPGKDFDVFLEPLVDDLLELWKGVDAYDARTDKSFKLRAAVLWCIHNYPALITLSGSTTKGYFACTAILAILGTTAFFQRDITWVETMSLSAYMKAMIHLVNSLKKS